MSNTKRKIKIKQTATAEGIMKMIRQRQDETKLNYKGKRLDKQLIIKWVEQRGISYTKMKQLVDRYDSNMTIKFNHEARTEFEYGSLVNLRELLYIIEEKIMELLINANSNDKVVDYFKQLEYDTDLKIGDWDEDQLQTAISNEMVNMVEEYYKLPHREFTSNLIRTCIKDDCRQVNNLLESFDCYDYIQRQKEINERNKQQMANGLRDLLKTQQEMDQ